MNQKRYYYNLCGQVFCLFSSRSLIVYSLTFDSCFFNTRVTFSPTTFHSVSVWYGSYWAWKAYPEFGDVEDQCLIQPKCSNGMCAQDEQNCAGISLHSQRLSGWDHKRVLWTRRGSCQRVPSCGHHVPYRYSVRPEGTQASIPKGWGKRTKWVLPIVMHQPGSREQGSPVDSSWDPVVPPVRGNWLIKCHWNI